ncbi:MAG: DUF5305 family protein [Haloquadratum sp.]|jgi:hypothetical protein|nr:DUF5305 family protein [Haloquadratum sp.]
MSLGDRIQLVIVEHPRLVPLVVIAAGLSLAAVAITLAFAPPTEVVTEEAIVQEYAFETESQAPVTVENELYPQGTLLRDHPEYFLAYSPELVLLVRTEAPPTTTVELVEQVQLRVIGSDGERVFYDRTETLTERRHTIRDGEHTHETAIDMRALSERMRALIDASDGVGTFELQLIVSVAYETEVYEGRITDRTALVIDEPVYYLSDTLAASQEESLTVTDTALRSPDPLVYYGSMVGALTMLLALFPIWRIRSIADPAQLRVAITRDRHTEWVSAGELPTTGDHEYVRTETLQDLIDIAIDSDRRVIHDVALDIYGVIDNGEIFFFSPWDHDVGDWLRL